jgi:hypothetical protein
MSTPTPISAAHSSGVAATKGATLNGQAPHWSIDVEQAARHIARLTGAPNGHVVDVTFQTFDDNKTEGHVKDGTLAKTIHGSLADHVYALNRLHASGAGIYITVNVTQGHRRRNIDVVEGRAVFIEDDHGANLTPPIAPQLTIESSPGKSHRYYLTSTADLKQWRKVQGRLVQDFGSDPNAQDPARVLRLAGSWHLKDPAQPHRVRILECTDAPPYSWGEIEKAIPWTPAPDLPEEEPEEQTTATAQLKAEALIAGAVDKNLIRDLRSALPFLDAESRAVWVDVGLALKSLGTDGLRLYEAYSQQSTKFYDVVDFQKQWKGYRPTHIDYRWIFNEAKKAGWINPLSSKTSAAAADTTGAILSITPVGLAVLEAAPDEPDVIVEKLMLMDAQGLVAPGSTGKTTLAIFEGIHIVLGRKLWGREIVKPGKVLFVTAEDSYKMTVSRLNHIVRALDLTPTEREIVSEGFFVEDVSTTDARLVRAEKNGLICPTKLFADIVAGYSDQHLSLVHLDPASLLGPGELTGNDGMAELMRTARRISTATGATCQIVHHVAQVVARNGVQDQYAGRGGTAFADNSRGNRQLVRIGERGYEFRGKKYRMPDTISDDDLERGRVLAILVHKLSYVELDPYPIFILRQGYRFTQFYAEAAAAKPELTPDEQIQVIAGFIQRELVHGHRHTPSSLQARPKDFGLSQSVARTAIKVAIEQGVFVWAKSPKRGGAQRYLKVAEDVPDDIQTPV